MPVKAASEYLRRLVQQGFRVAICEQVEDPKLAKGIVKREVIETITPGAAFADDLLDGGAQQLPLRGAAGGAGERAMAGVAAADVSTGELRLVRRRRGRRSSRCSRGSRRASCWSGAARRRRRRRSLRDVDGALLTEREAWEFDPALARDELTRQFGVHSLDGLGIGAGDDVGDRRGGRAAALPARAAAGRAAAPRAPDRRARRAARCRSTR